jgi:hypothetical protein
MLLTFGTAYIYIYILCGYHVASDLTKRKPCYQQLHTLQSSHNFGILREMAPVSHQKSVPLMSVLPVTGYYELQIYHHKPLITERVNGLKIVASMKSNMRPRKAYGNRIICTWLFLLIQIGLNSLLRIIYFIK